MNKSNKKNANKSAKPSSSNDQLGENASNEIIPEKYSNLKSNNKKGK